jgi:hypothetical protein
MSEKYDYAKYTTETLTEWNEILRKSRHALVEKWDEKDLLDNLSETSREKLSVLLENTHRNILSKDDAYPDNLKSSLLTLVRLVFDEFLELDNFLVMDAPASLYYRSETERVPVVAKTAALSTKLLVDPPDERLQRDFYYEIDKEAELLSILAESLKEDIRKLLDKYGKIMMYVPLIVSPLIVDSGEIDGEPYESIYRKFLTRFAVPY